MQLLRSNHRILLKVIIFCSVFSQAEIFDTNPNISYNLRFTEAGWRSQLNDQAVPRELFMTALQNVTNIFVRASSSVAFTKLT